MTNFRVASVDGFGDRDDIALERDRMQENRPPQGYTRWEDYHAGQAALENSNTWGIASNAKSLRQHIQQMLETECYGKLLLKSEVILQGESWVDELYEALDDACIALGLSSDEFSPSIHDQGNEINLRLV